MIHLENASRMETRLFVSFVSDTCEVHKTRIYGTKSRKIVKCSCAIVIILASWKFYILLALGEKNSDVYRLRRTFRERFLETVIIPQLLRIFSTNYPWMYAYSNIPLHSAFALSSASLILHRDSLLKKQKIFSCGKIGTISLKASEKSHPSDEALNFIWFNHNMVLFCIWLLFLNTSFITSNAYIAHWHENAPYIFHLNRVSRSKHSSFSIRYV